MCYSKENNSDLSCKVKAFSMFMIIFWIILGFITEIHAQTNDSIPVPTSNQQIWIDIFPHYYVNEKLEYYGDGGYRTIVDKDSWNRVYARPSLKYHINPRWTVHAGLGLFYIWEKNITDRFEITPWQGIEFNWPTLDKISFQHLAKIEERLSFLTNDWTSSFELRFRYKISGKIDLLDNNWFIPFYGEFFIPLQNSIDEIYRNKGRIGIGIGRKAINDWEFAFMFNWQGSRSGQHEELGVSDYAYQIKIKKLWKAKIRKKIKSKMNLNIPMILPPDPKENNHL
jgi:hypothetical protein